MCLMIDNQLITLGNKMLSWTFFNTYWNTTFQSELGYLEYSGVTGTGEEVMGLAQFQKFQRDITPDQKLSLVVPKGWSLEDAVTVPLAYTTVSIQWTFSKW